MARSAFYPPANTTAQRFDDDYSSVRFTSLHKVVLHTEEIPTGWPGYKGGASAPNMSGNPSMKARRIDWRGHFPADRSARALRNEDGGVSTNAESDGVFQIELAGTCDPGTVAKWRKRGLTPNVDYIYWPEAPDWALRELARVLAWLNVDWGVPLAALPASRWPSFPKSYGKKSRARMSFREWDTFAGICGHAHVPENTHGDPGSIDIDRLLVLARQEAAALRGKPVPPAPPAKPRRPVKRRTVVVRKGQTLAGIAAAAGISLAALLAANPGIKDPAVVQPGQTVTVPPATSSTRPAPRPTKTTPAKRPTATPKTPQRPARPVLKVGSRGPLVRVVQRAVGVTPDGVYGTDTRAAVARYQRARGLTGDGIVGPATWARIRP